ncbi:MAG: flagellar assembly protein FliW [Solirubrobacteraceae bacterium]
MSVTFESVRFGTVEVPQQEVLEFPLGLIGLGGQRYAILDRNPGSGFFWLHSVDDPALALPIVRPHLFFADFALEISAADRELTGIEDTAAAEVYVTVRAAPDPMDTTANLRAPILIHAGQGFQVLNEHEPAPLQAHLFELAEQHQGERVSSADAA